jgi:hypothetical protein
MNVPVPIIATAMAAAIIASAASPAVAGPKCTTEPQSKWLTEDQMMGKIQAMGYKDIKNFHVSKGKCYEIYGYDKESRRVEVYFHPISGEIAESNFQ